MIQTAIKFIRYDKSKSIGVVIGIVISIFLIGQQIGILGFLTGLMGGLIENSRKDVGQIWVIDNITQNANELGQLDERLVREIRSIEGVENTYAIIASNGLVKFKNGKTASVLLVGSEAPVFVAGPNESKIHKGSIDDLLMDGAVSAELFDEKIFDNSLEIGNRVEINGKEAFIRMQTKNARGFAGAFFYTTLSKARFYSNFAQNKVSAIAVKVKPGYEVATVVRNINAAIYGVKAWDANELQQSTISFITISSNIGTSVGSLVVFAIISGFFIIGLTLYSSALDRIKDYGTLKAIGATNSYVRNLILLQSFIFALLGFALALSLLLAFKKGVENAGLVISYSAIEISALFIITVFISVGGSFFAIKKINSVEPASVFRG
ncbi:ABC transporter, permease component [Mariniradius saccharolyticus AK6]|uniref:ABC transporter, permease component n=1 Tax=Mariniradius saccharolyticus AK6 TaxID=1239962 RepID=M7XYU9_9BACT|nr:FtsX-like permease family protein [Mariniradius saccharolyticus]EMS33662.1 ABC transporter, permease component [Mariniradius saccharolyticus AK6]